MGNAKVGRVEYSVESIVHPSIPHAAPTMPLEGGEAYPAGTVLQMNASNKLEAGDFTKRSYIALKDIKEDDADAVVLAFGAAKTESLLKITTDSQTSKTEFVSLTTDDAIELMENTPIVCI